MDNRNLPDIPKDGAGDAAWEFVPLRLNGKLPDSPKDGAAVYRRLVMGKVGRRTREAYADDLRDFADFLGIEPAGDGHPLETLPDEAWRELDTAHVAAYLEHLKNTVSGHTGRPYSTATIARRMTAIKELLTEAAYLGLFPRNRLEYLKERLSTPEVTHEHHSGITPEEQARLLETADVQPGLKGLRDSPVAGHGPAAGGAGGAEGAGPGGEGRHAHAGGPEGQRRAGRVIDRETEQVVVDVPEEG